MGRNTLILNGDKLEDLIVEAFKNYEKGLWPFHMRTEAIAIVNACKIVLDKRD